MSRTMSILGLNTGIYTTESLTQQQDDPFEQFQFITDSLESAQKNGKSVHIIGHVPPGCK